MNQIEVRMGGKPGDEEAVRTFIASMYSDWYQQSSLGCHSSCCPDRERSEIENTIYNALNNDSLILALNESGETIGMAVIEYGDRWKRSAELSLLNINPGSRSKGLGKKIVGLALIELAKARYRILTMETWPDNTQARALFESCGSVFTGEGCGNVTYENRVAMLLRDEKLGLRDNLLNGDFHLTVNKNGDVLCYDIDAKEKLFRLNVLVA